MTRGTLTLLARFLPEKLSRLRQIDGALAGSPGGPREWGICTECGMGRVAAGDVPRLLDLHREILAT